MENGTNITVEYNSYCMVTRHADPNEEYDGDDTDCSHTIRGIKIADRYQDFTVSFEVKPDHKYWLVYGIYSTGDSFSHSSGNIEFVDLFETEEHALDVARVLEEHNRIYRNAEKCYSRKPIAPPKGYLPYTVSYCREDGHVLSYHVPWHGYFEDLSDIEVVSVSLIEKGE